MENVRKTTRHIHGNANTLVLQNKNNYECTRQIGGSANILVLPKQKFMKALGPII